MTDPALVRKKLAAIETALVQLRTRAAPDRPLSATCSPIGSSIWNASSRSCGRVSTADER